MSKMLWANPQKKNNDAIKTNGTRYFLSTILFIIMGFCIGYRFGYGLLVMGYWLWVIGY